MGKPRKRVVQFKLNTLAMCRKMRYVDIDFDSGVGSRWNTRVIINYKVPGLGNW